MKKYAWTVFGLAVFAGSMVAVFLPVLPKFAALLTPDSMPFFPFAYRTVTLEKLLAGNAFTPHVLYWLLFHPLVAHELNFILDTLVLALGGVYYLRARNVHALAAWTGGLALGLSGYTFTLFCAGHRGYFDMFCCAVWSFGLIARGCQTRSLFHFAALGLVFAWGVPFQPDVLVLVGALAGAYALWLTARGGDAPGGRLAGAGRLALAVWPRFLVSLAVFGLAGFGGIRSAVTTQIANRDAQIAGSMAPAQAAEQKDGQPAVDPRSRWIFATNWSLPPEDMLEFVVPGVFGDESMQGAYPYWGRLGRPHHEVFQKGRMMPNYRQHTVYLGVVPVMLALLAALAYFTRRREQPEAASGPAPADHSDVPFWCAAWAVCLALAMGRYLPLYRLFYAIPYMDYIRAPVKFHHLVEIATAFLAGFGMDAFLRGAQGRARRLLLRLALVAAGLLLLGLVVSAVAKPAVVRQITELGLGQVAAPLGGYLQQNLARSLALAAAVAALAFIAVRVSGPKRLALVGSLFAALLCADQAWVAKRYVKALDVEAHYRENAATQAIARHGAPGEVANVINYATPNSEDRSWFSGSLVFNGIRNLMPTLDEQSKDYGKLFMGLQQDPVRLWRLLNVQFVMVGRKAAEPLMRAGALRPLLDFEVGEKRLQQTGQPGERTVTLAAVCGAASGSRAVTRWAGDKSAQAQVDEAGRSPDVVSAAPSPAPVPADAATPRLESLSARGRPLAFETRLLCDSAAPALVLFNERFNDSLEARVDGQVVPCYLSDGVWASAVVPAGKHQVVLRKRRDVWPAALSAAAALAVAGLFVARKLRG